MPRLVTLTLVDLHCSQTMQLAGEDRSDAVRRDRRLRDRRERADASVRSTGLGEHCKSTRRGMRWVFIILTSSSFFLGESYLSVV
jgi:hypothetical protein